VGVTAQAYARAADCLRPRLRRIVGVIVSACLTILLALFAWIGAGQEVAVAACFFTLVTVFVVWNALWAARRRKALRARAALRRPAFAGSRPKRREPALN